MENSDDDNQMDNSDPSNPEEDIKNYSKNGLNIPPTNSNDGSGGAKGSDSEPISIEEEMKHNARIPQGQSLEKFVDIMKNLNLANPKKIDVSVPANLTCGRVTQQA